jgi:hypothetical protein
MRGKSFNVGELAGVVVLTLLLSTLLLPMGNHAQARSYSSQLRGIHQGLVTFANSNKNWYAGVDASGNDAGITIEERYQLMMEGDFFTPEYAISPSEDDPLIHEWSETGTVTQDNYSYAMLQVPNPGARREEWKQTLNSQAIVMSDRNVGNMTDTFGIHSHGYRKQTGSYGCTSSSRLVDHWVGQILWNDNHVEFIETDSPDTQYGVVSNTSDNLFRSTGDNDALVIHSGN